MTRHKCKECGKSFDLKRYLTKHEIRMHKNSEKSKETERSMEPLKCNMCDKVFSRLSHLQRHQMTHLNVRDFSCNFCDEKFAQKAHLTRHVTRKHANESGVEVNWVACDKCGHLFKTSYEMKIHRKTVHELHRCKRCREVIEAGNDGLRQHHIRCRNKEKMCDRCGASFGRPADLRAHQTSCLNKVAFMCTPCGSFFKQRTELDRHIKKLHFRSAKCSKCDNVSETPVQNSRHVLECLKLEICGFCNLENPDESHVKDFHWQRMKRAIPKRIAEKQKRNEKDDDTPSCSNDPSGRSERSEDVDLSDSSDKSKSNEHAGSRLERSSDEKITEDDEDTLFDFPEPSTSDLDFYSSAFKEEDDALEEYLTFSICPKDADLSFHLRGRLPPQLISLFPELENTSIVLLNSVNAPRCRMTVRVPVCIPKWCEKEAEMRKWLGNSIVLSADS